MSRRKLGVVIDERMRGRMRALAERVGEYEAARLLEVNIATFARGVAGFGVWPGTEAQIAQKLPLAEEA